MTRITQAILTLFVVSLLSAGCKKAEPPIVPACKVIQFGYPARALYPGDPRLVTPYVFKNTFDAAGRITSCDGFIYSLGHSQDAYGLLTYKGNTIIVLNQRDVADTLMIISLNSNGRVMQAEEKGTFSTSPFRYAFTYNAQDKLTDFSATYSTGQTFNNICRYDSLGNCTRGANVAYEYDYSRKATQQYYMDVENLSNIFYGMRFLEYLNFFPEITSPKNIRVKSTVMSTATGGTPVLSFDLKNHQFDEKGKLISYDFLDYTNVPITYNCDNPAR